MRAKGTHILFCAVAACLPMRAQNSAAKAPSILHYDRMQTVEMFLDAVYPDLAQQKGMLTFQNYEFNIGTGVGNIYVHFLQCRPGSGVPVSSQRAQFHPCPAPLLCFPSPYLSASVKLRSTDRHPVAGLGAGGELVLSELGPLREEIRKHGEWSEGQMLEALKRAKPSFGPDHRAEFLKSIPVETLYEFTGCRLDPGTARMWVARLGGPPDVPEIHVEWLVSGKIKNSGDTCTATFEPFHGRLLTILD